MVCAVLGVWIAGRYEEWLPGTHALVLGLGGRAGRTRRRPVRVVRQARGPHQGLRRAVRRPRRRARPPRRGAVHGGGRVLHLGGVRALTDGAGRAGDLGRPCDPAVSSHPDRARRRLWRAVSSTRRAPYPAPPALPHPLLRSDTSWLAAGTRCRAPGALALSPCSREDRDGRDRDGDKGNYPEENY